MVDRVNIKEMIPALPDEKIGNSPKHTYLFLNLTLPLPIMYCVYMIYKDYIAFICVLILFISQKKKKKW